MSDSATVQPSQVKEYERQPVPESATKGWRSFIGMYAGEHAAGTEFMIGTWPCQPWTTPCLRAIGWVPSVMFVGVLISIVPAFAYDTVAYIANIAAPWMVLVFAACGIAALPQLGVHYARSLATQIAAVKQDSATPELITEFRQQRHPS